MILRRSLLILLVLAALSQVGCAQYEVRQEMADRGTVLLTWEVDPSRVPGNHCGYAAQVAKDHWLVTFRRKYDFNHECIVHELGHVMGARH